MNEKSQASKLVIQAARQRRVLCDLGPLEKQSPGHGP